MGKERKKMKEQRGKMKEKGEKDKEKGIRRYRRSWPVIIGQALKCMDLSRVYPSDSMLRTSLKG